MERSPGSPSQPGTPLSDRATPTPTARLAQLINESSCTVALTGAGISVPSGIPDFRSPGEGLWQKVDPMEVAHIDSFRRDPARFWSFYRPRLHSLGGVEPNPAHEALAELERRGLVEAVVTQNIDMLHVKAGSERVIEVHGSIRSLSCQSCGRSFAIDESEELFDSEGVARCSGCGGLVKPDVVLFGELLPADAMAEAEALAARADLMLCVGSSLEVYPVAGLPSVTLGRGGRLAIVTKGPTPYDRDAALRLEGDVAEELSAVVAEVRGRSDNARARDSATP
jgi:NAD-dependent protein deacetylase/lipoamidase